MMNNLFILCLLSTIAVLSNAQSNGGYCQTPDNRNGNCVSIRSCDILLRLATKRVLFPNDILFLDQSKCGSIANYVCCPVAEGTITTSTPRPTRIPTTTRRLTTTTTTPISDPGMRISAKKCIDYADYAYNQSYTVNIFGPPKVTKTSNCAFLAQGLIMEGEEVKRKEFPHMALIGSRRRRNQILWLCGGTLISEQFVLSASHCARSSGVPAQYVRLGEHDLSQTNDANHIDFNIIERIVHPNVGERTYNDIILFKLDRQVEFNHAIRPACLPQQSTVPRNVSASGWGVTSFNGTRSDLLLKVDLTTFSKSERLNSTTGRDFSSKYEDESIVFAGHLTESKDTCQGDSGGPLQALHDSHHCTYTVFGVTATGYECGHAGTPAIYTAVFKHLDWIEETVWPNK